MERTRLRRILGLALPIIGGMTSQNILNLVDTAMVGRLGDPALAAVGIGGFAGFLATAMILGLSSGVQTIAARRLGEGRADQTGIPLNGGLLVACAAGLPWGLLLAWQAPTFFPWLNDDPAVIAEGVPYVRIRLLAIAFVGMNFSFRGFWNATDRSHLYMRTLLVMHATNIVLNYVLIFGKLGLPAMGTAGAGLGTALSTVVGTLYYIALALKHARGSGFGTVRPTRQTVGALLRLAIPNGVQQTFFAAGLTAMFWIIGQVGTAELAAAAVLINLTLVCILPGIGLGLAATTLVGQALGRGDVADAKQWAWDVVKVAVVVLGALGAPLALAPRPILGVFIQDPATIELGRWPLVLIGGTIWLEGLGLVLIHALLGAGAQTQVMALSILLQWGFFLPGAYVIGPVLGYGLLAIWVLNGVQRALLGGVFAAIWTRGRWAEHRL